MIWRPIPSLPGYEASSEGTIRRVTPRLNGKPLHTLNGNTDKRGYCYITGWIDGVKGPRVGVHVLVCEAFHGPRPSPDHEVAHGDGQPSNNRPGNLRWATGKENAADKRRHGRVPVGVLSGTAKIADSDVVTIFQLAAARTRQRDIAARFGINQAQVWRILRRKSWAHVDVPADLVAKSRHDSGYTRRVASAMGRWRMRRPLAIDLFCGLGGWTDGLLAEGYDVIGFDIERHVYGEHRYPAQLVVQDVLTLHGSQFRDAALIVASPPCQEFSWMAMPWSRAKQVAAALRGEAEFPDGYRGSRTVADLTRLFDACFRIQREACEAGGGPHPHGG